jgi:quercetin dioxygenase-like cupin family protein
MSREHQQEQASLYALDALPEEDRSAFEAALRDDAELQQLVRTLRRAAGALALTVPARRPPADLKQKILQQIPATPDRSASLPLAGQLAGFSFLAANDSTGWKALPVPGAWIKVLSLDREHGYAVLLGKLDAGARYPAHTHEGSEDLYLLTGDLHIGDHVMRPGDFHHSDAGTSHEENHSLEGCTLLCVVSIDHAMARFAMA